MSQSPNLFSDAYPWNQVAVGYAETTMLSLSSYASTALQMANLNLNQHIIDVACGPGTLSLLAAQQVSQVTSLDFSEKMLALLRQQIQTQGIKNIDVNFGDGQQLPFADNTFDAAFSMFGLMFFPDRLQGFRELHRVLKSGCCAVVSSWAPVGRSPMMEMMFALLKKINPDLPEAGKSIESLESEDIFYQEMTAAGFQEVEIKLVTKLFRVSTVEEVWDLFVRGSVPIVMLKEKLGPDAWVEKEKIALEYLYETLSQNSLELTFDAWFWSEIVDPPSA